jgi:hypothetical protein
MSLIDAKSYPYTQGYIDFLESYLKEKLKYTKISNDDNIKKLMIAILNVSLVYGGISISEIDSIVKFVLTNR